MFTDVEVGMAIGHGIEMRAATAEAQAIIDAKNRAIARLQRQLAVAQAGNRDLIIERGQRNNAMLAARIARRH